MKRNEIICHVGMVLFNDDYYRLLKAAVLSGLPTMNLAILVHFADQLLWKQSWLQSSRVIT